MYLGKKQDKVVHVQEKNRLCHKEHGEERKLTSVCRVSNVLSVASTDEELDLREQCLKVRDVGHGELHKSRITKHRNEHNTTQVN